MNDCRHAHPLEQKRKEENRNRKERGKKEGGPLQPQCVVSSLSLSPSLPLPPLSSFLFPPLEHPLADEQRSRSCSLILSFSSVPSSFLPSLSLFSSSSSSSSSLLPPLLLLFLPPYPPTLIEHQLSLLHPQAPFPSLLLHLPPPSSTLLLLSGQSNLLPRESSTSSSFLPSLHLHPTLAPHRRYV